MRLIFASLIMFSIGFAQIPAPVPIPESSVELPTDVQRVLTDYEAAWSAKDAPALAKLFTVDGFVMPDGGHPVRGRAQIEKFYAGSGGPLSLRAIHFEAEGSVGFMLGGFSGKPGEPDRGKFTLTLRREAGRWMIVSDMDSPNQRRSQVLEN
jgi:ketosteroid isomerase-like protein